MQTSSVQEDLGPMQPKRPQGPRQLGIPEGLDRTGAQGPISDRAVWRRGTDIERRGSASGRRTFVV